VLSSNVTAISVTSGVAQDLRTFSIPADTLAVNGQSIWFDILASFSSSANAKTFTVHFGATTLGTFASGGGTSLQMRLHGRIWRTGAATQRAWCTIENTINLTPFGFYTEPTETLSGAITIKGRGDSGAINEITQLTLLVGWNDVNS
jgi:hypothetical protein